MRVEYPHLRPYARYSEYALRSSDAPPLQASKAPPSLGSLGSTLSTLRADTGVEDVGAKAADPRRRRVPRLGADHQAARRRYAAAIGWFGSASFAGPVPLVVPSCVFACLRRAARAGARRSGRVALAAHSAPLRVLAVSGTASSKEEGPAGTGPIIQRCSAVGPAGPTAQAGWPGPLRAAVCHRRESNARQAEAPAPSTVLGIAWALPNEATGRE